MSIISTNPITRDILWKGNPSTKKEIDSAITSGRQALTHWSNLAIEERETYLKKYQDTLINTQDTFAETISQETGKPLWESKSEVKAMLAKVDISIQAQQIRCQQLTKDQSSGRSITRHKPIGVLAVFGPFNFPGHLPNGHIVPALLAGNTVVFKPSELTPLVGEKLYQLLLESGIPEGVVNLIQGSGEEGKSLSQHPDIDGILFTGSWKTGRLLARQLGEQPQKLLALEMGGNNPLIIWDIEDIDAAAYVTVQSAYLTSGQRCTCARRLILPDEALSDHLIEKLKTLISGLKIGAYTDSPEPFMGPVINQEAVDKVLEAQNYLGSHGGRIITEVRQILPGTPLLSPGLIDVTNVHDRSDEEIFGPFLQVIRVKNFDAAIEEANRTKYGLCGSILTDEKRKFDTFYQKSRMGVINWNMPTTGASSESPFGGVKQSGNYRPSAFYAADYCNYPVASLEATKIELPKQPLPGIHL